MFQEVRANALGTNVKTGSLRREIEVIKKENKMESLDLKNTVTEMKRIH